MMRRFILSGAAQKKSEREAKLKALFEQEKLKRSEKLQGANLYLKNITAEGAIFLSLESPSRL